MKKKNGKWWSIFFVIISIMIGTVLFVVFEKNLKDVNWDIVIRYHWSDPNPLAGVSIIDEETLYINSKKCVGKVTYMKVNRKKETTQFKIKKEEIDKIIQLAEQGKSTLEEAKSNKATSKYKITSVYEISLNTKTAYVDSKLDNENIISRLFNTAINEK